MTLHLFINIVRVEKQGHSTTANIDSTASIQKQQNKSKLKNKITFFNFCHRPTWGEEGVEGKT